MYRALCLSIIVHFIILIPLSVNKKNLSFAEEKSIKSNLVFYRKSPVKKEIEKKEEVIEKNEVKTNHLAENFSIDKKSNFVHEKKIEKKVEPIKKNKKEIKEEILTRDTKNENIIVEKKVENEIIEEKEVIQKEEYIDEEVKVVEEPHDNKKVVNNPLENHKDFFKDTDGSFIAINPNNQGINLTFKSNPHPKYPENFRRIRLRRGLVIETTFIINTLGKVENIKLLNTNPKEFEDEVIKALELWTFEPVVYNGQNIKVKVNKNFIFK